MRRGAGLIMPQALKQVHGMLVSMWGTVATLTVTFSAVLSPLS